MTAPAVRAFKSEQSLETRTDRGLTVAGQIWNLKCEYEERLAVGCDRLLALEAQGDPAWAMFDYWLRIEAEYRVVHSCFTLEAANIKFGKPPHFKSIGEVIRLLAV